jgi:type VI protein secretion system component VasF
MSGDFDKQLREALRAVDPDAGFAERVAGRIARHRRRLALPRWVPQALAASLLVGALGIYGWHAQRERQGLEARQQLLEALRLTGEKLDLAYKGVRDVSKPATADGAGA